jgi:hypothetical protein
MNEALGKKAPMARELLQAIRGSFEQIEDPRRRLASNRFDRCIDVCCSDVRVEISIAIEV